MGWAPLRICPVCLEYFIERAPTNLAVQLKAQYAHCGKPQLPGKINVDWLCSWRCPAVTESKTPRNMRDQARVLLIFALLFIALFLTTQLLLHPAKEHALFAWVVAVALLGWFIWIHNT